MVRSRRVSRLRRSRRRSLGRGIALLACCIPAVASAAETTFGDAGCILRDGEIGIVTAVPSAVSLQLESGLSVRLAGIMPPGDETDAMAWLEEHLIGQEIQLRYGSLDRDRYGQAFAQAYVTDGLSEAWIQAEMIANGIATVAGFREERTCLADLLTFERDARAQRIGSWSRRLPISAWSPLLRDAPPRYEFIEGLVVSVGRTDRTVYLNFGRDWSVDLTVTIDAADLGVFETGGVVLDDLAGHAIRVRGWLEQWDGPWVRIDHPEQIEVLDRDHGEGGSG